MLRFIQIECHVDIRMGNVEEILIHHMHLDWPHHIGNIVDPVNVGVPNMMRKSI